MKRNVATFGVIVVGIAVIFVGAIVFHNVAEHSRTLAASKPRDLRASTKFSGRTEPTALPAASTARVGPKSALLTEQASSPLPPLSASLLEAAKSWDLSEAVRLGPGCTDCERQKSEYVDLIRRPETPEGLRSYLATLLAESGDPQLFDSLFEAATSSSGKQRENILLGLRSAPRNAETAQRAGQLLATATAPDLERELLTLLSEEGSPNSAQQVIEFVARRGDADVAGYDPIRFLMVSDENQAQIAQLAGSDQPGNRSALLALLHSTGESLRAGLNVLDQKFDSSTVEELLTNEKIQLPYHPDLVTLLKPIADSETVSASRSAARALLDGMQAVNYEALS